MISKQWVAIIFIYIGIHPIWSQNTNARVSLQKGLQELSDLYEVNFAYDPLAISHLEINEKILKDNLSSTLASISMSVPVDFRFVDDRHLIVTKRAITPLTGQVVDISTSEPLAFAAVFIVGTVIGTEADDSGHFTLMIPDSLYNREVQINFLGYQPKRFFSFGGKNIHRLQPTEKEIPVIEVDAPTNPISNINQTGNYSITKELPSTLGIVFDPIKQLQLLPGINSTEDFSAGLNIRGSSNNDNLIVLNGINLYNVDHFYGIISAVQSSSVDTITLYKNAFPVQYGGATGGVLSISSSPAKNEIEGEASLNLLEGGLNLRIPLTPNLSFSTSARTSINNLGEGNIYQQYHNLTRNNPLNQFEYPGNISTKITALTPDFSFYDGGFNIYFKKHQFSFFRSEDLYKLKYEDSFQTKLRNNTVINSEKYEEQELWQNQGWSWQSNFKLLKNWSSFLHINYSSFKNEFEREAYLGKQFINNLESLSFDNEFQSNVVGKYFTFSNEKLWSGNQVKWGAAFTQHFINNTIENHLEEKFERKTTGAIYSLFGSHSLGIGSDWNFKLGIRSNYYAINNRNYLSPRLEIKFFPNSKHSFYSTFSHYQQFLRTINSEDGLGQSRSLWNLADLELIPVLTATNATLGWKAIWKNGWVLEMEGYYKVLNGVVEYAPQFSSLLGNSSNRKPRFTFFKGKGKIRGLDVLLRKSSTRWNLFLAYTWSKNTQAFPAIANNMPFPSSSDRRHQLNYAASYKWKKWTLSTVFSFASGRPYTDLKKINERIAENPRTILTPEKRISYLKDYHRFDLKLNWSPLGVDGPWQIGLGIFNVLDRVNTAYRQYAFVFTENRNDSSFLKNTVAGNEVYMLGRTVTFDLNFSF